jgi:anti-anti-sigma regulatory factor
LPKVRFTNVATESSYSAAVLNGAGMEGFCMQATTTDKPTSVLHAPERIIAATRSEFRGAAIEFLESLSSDAHTLVIDMSRTVELDASGLGILVLIQKRAKERGLSTHLRQTPERVRNLLKLTMLDFLFELTD